ncbi:hypothetical protein C8Q70DRAFT_947956 [Cubamyces menziesii]|nr:hypothetical protein C8Q70DRAFT_947956 [Cubamyces menziesii]
MSEDVNPEQLLKAVTLKPYGSAQEHPLLWSSFKEDERHRLIPHTNGFIETILLACAYHHNLRIRPDDVWIAILTQLSAYFYAHPEFRDHFVTAEGKKDVVIGQGRRTRRRTPTGPELLSQELEKTIRTNAADSTSAEWILPSFTTTTQDDSIVCSVLALSKPRPTCNHFASVDMRRGIPNITLDGSKDDWQKILQRLDRLYELGDEPSVWATMLRPILRRFVSAFDGEVDVHFWEHLVYLPFDPFEMLVVNGWITAFCVWNFFGKWQGGPLPEKVPRPPSRLKVDAKRGVVGTRLKKLFRIGPASSSDSSAGNTECEDGRQVDGSARGSVVEQGGESSIFKLVRAQYTQSQASSGELGVSVYPRRRSLSRRRMWNLP